LGSEELPPQDVTDGIAQLQLGLAQKLEEARLGYERISVTGTTRRLVVHVTGLAPCQADAVVEKKGPPADRAFDADGNPTKAATGFARGQGIDVADLEVRDNYVYAVQKIQGEPAIQVLPGLLTELLDGLRWRKTMRWNASNQGYPRPLRWIVALFGEQIVPFTWAGIPSGRVSRGPRFADASAHLPPGEFTTFSVENGDAYFDAVAAQGVLLNRQDRQARIQELVDQTAAATGGTAPVDPDLLEEVTDLVEAPFPVLGEFEQNYLALPKPVLIGVMKKHQRYFPVMDQAGNLMPYFVTIANSAELAHSDVVKRGNEGVIRARYADAAFFWQADTAKPLADFTPGLATLTFHEKLGSMLEKVQRLEALAPKIAAMLGASQAEQETASRAAALSKSDLVTNMVVEMTSLQGIMGEIYAAKGGEAPAVAQAIREHYLPRFAGDASPQSLPGLALSLADKLDSLAGLFGVGVQPSGSADPFGLRRAGLGIVNNLMEAKVDFSVAGALGVAAQGFGLTISEQALLDAGEFITRRLQGVLLETGYPHDVVEAVLAERGDNPHLALLACEHLSESVVQPWWADAFTAYARCARIVKNIEEDLPLDPEAYETDVERDLHRAFVAAQSGIEQAGQPSAILGEQIQALAAPINAFFDGVMVNAEDARVRQARQALVQKIAQLPRGVADLSQLQGF
jgi:glycyl-tRNA synthetase